MTRELKETLDKIRTHLLHKKGIENLFLFVI